MGYDTSDIYYQPEKFNLESIGSVDIADSYEFNIIAVWKHKPTGKLYWAQDSGCSCPTPFEDYTSLEKLEEITENNLDQFQEILKDHKRYYSESGWDIHSLELFQKVWKYTLRINVQMEEKTDESVP